MPVTALANVYQILLVGVVLGQETINRFFYGDDVAIASVGDTIAAFHDTVITALIPVMSVNSGFTRVDLQQVKGGVAFGSVAMTDVGAASGDTLPPYASWDFTFLRGGARERNGYKRIAGVPEIYQIGGQAASGVLAALATAADAMFQPLTPTGSDLVPVIRRTRVNRVPVSPAQYWNVSNVVYSRIGTQNSRKFGHGR